MQTIVKKIKNNKVNFLLEEQFVIKRRNTWQKLIEFGEVNLV